MASILKNLSQNRDLWLSYGYLARLIYAVEEPSRAQRGAVARAARRLEELGYIVVGHPNKDDLRITYVTLPD